MNEIQDHARDGADLLMVQHYLFKIEDVLERLQLAGGDDGRLLVIKNKMMHESNRLLSKIAPSFTFVEDAALKLAGLKSGRRRTRRAKR